MRKLRPVDDNLISSSRLLPLYHRGPPSSTSPAKHWFRNAKAGHSGSTPDEQTTQTNEARAPLGWSLALRWTNLSQNRQGVCCLSWGRSASFSSSQAASSPLSDSSGRSSSSSKAPRPPSTRKWSDLLQMPVPSRRTKSRVGRKLSRGWAFPDGSRQHLPHPPCKAPPPSSPSRGGKGLLPAPLQRGLGDGRAGWVLRGWGYPPVAPDANEHMAMVPPEPRALGAGTGLSNERAGAAEISEAGPPGASASARASPSARQGQGLGNFADA